VGNKKLLNLFITICLISSLVVPLVLFSACEKEIPPEEVVELKFATFRPPTDPQSEVWITPMLQEIEERTNGQVKFTVYWSEALGASRDQYTLVKDGVADMTDFAGAWVPGKFVLSDVGNLPLAAQDPANLIKAMEILQEEGYFDTQWDEVEWLSWNCTTPYKFLFREVQPTTYEGLVGLKARTPGGVMTDYLTEVGMVPVTVLPGDAYTAWQTGLVDVWVHPPGAVVKYKFNELPTKALLDVGLFCTVNAATIFNKAKFASLPSDVQETILEVVQDYSRVYLQSGTDTDNDALDVMEAAGIEVFTWSEAEVAKLTAAALPIWEKYISDLEDAGLPGEELVSRFIEILEDLGEEPPSPH
jgi:TRAP-type C4-dicarboxylate transport system substrate-binding protein